MVSLKKPKRTGGSRKANWHLYEWLLSSVGQLYDFFKPLVLVFWENGNQITFGFGFLKVFKIQRKPALVFFSVHGECFY
jgi:hypothetical protein